MVLPYETVCSAELGGLGDSVSRSRRLQKSGAEVNFVEKKPSDKGPREKTTKVAEGNPANLWQLVASCCSALAHTISSLYVPSFFLVRLFSSLCFIMFTFGAFSRIYIHDESD